MRTRPSLAAPIWLAALAWALAGALAGCGSARRSPPARPANPDENLPANGYAGIKRVRAPIGGPTGCAPRGRVYTEHLRVRQRVVALTIDDGPTGYTHQVLDVLERKHVRATFFVIGNQVVDHPAQLRRELRDGDLIGNHTWTHPDLLRLPGRYWQPQLALTTQAIQAATGFTPCFWRAPYGSITPALERLARSLGMLSVQWDDDPEDYAMPPVRLIVRRVLYGNRHNQEGGVHPGAIVLLHDGGGDRSHTVQALPQIIDALRARGYRFVTIAQLLHLPISYRRH